MSSSSHNAYYAAGFASVTPPAKRLTDFAVHAPELIKKKRKKKSAKAEFINVVVIAQCLLHRARKDLTDFAAPTLELIF